MNGQKLLEKMMNKTLELYLRTERDKTIYGNTYVEFGERSIRVIDPKKVVVKIKKDGKIESIQDMIQEMTNQISWDLASHKEEVIKALIAIGINHKKCYFENDNLVIPVSEMQKAHKEEPKANLGCATTKQIMDELFTRIEIQAPELLNYRTIDEY